MKYKFTEKEKLNRAKKYLEDRNIAYSDFHFKDFSLINVYLDNIHLDEDIFNCILNMDEGLLTGKSYKKKTIVEVGKVKIGGQRPVFIAGPCSIDSEDSLFETGKILKEAGADLLRGGAFKPRTSPYDFQGLGRDGIDILKRVGDQLDLPIITEVVDIRDLEYVEQRVDIIQVGARNMQNFPLLKELGRIRKPVLLKRSFSSTINEFLLAGEYILSEGNEDLILCERGIRTFEKATRNTMDISAISLIKDISHLPILADPSHGTGLKSLIKPMSMASIAAGADGLLLEAHINPQCAITDAFQTIEPKDLAEIVEKSVLIKEIVK